DDPFKIDLWPGTDHLGDDGKIVAVGDLDWDRLAAGLSRRELELANGCYSRLIEVRPGAFKHFDVADFAVLANLDREQHFRRDAGVVLVLGIFRRNEVDEARWLDCVRLLRMDRC